MGLTTGRTGTAVRARGPARRFVLRTAFAVTVTAGTAGALLPVLTRDPGTGSRSRTGGDSGQDTDFGKNGVRGLERFAETYRGRLIEGAATPLVTARAPSVSTDGPCM